MPTTNSKNKEVRGTLVSGVKNFKPYYLIVNNENLDEVYFCFKRAVKEGWDDLVSNWEQIREVEIEFEEKENGFKVYRKVVSLWTQLEGEIFV